MTEVENQLFEQAKKQGIELSTPTWESCRAWLAQQEWKINVLSDYPKNEIKLAVRRGFERIEIMGHSDLEVILRAIMEIHRRDAFEKSETTPPELEA